MKINGIGFVSKRFARPATLALAALGLASNAFAAAGGERDRNADYVREVASLLDSLEPSDPLRLSLSLKLADAYFDDALSLSGESPVSQADERTMNAERKRAERLYESAALGLDGAFPKPMGARGARIDFQLARLLSDQGRPDAAHAYWLKLSADGSPLALRREALLRIAEEEERAPTPAKLKQAEGAYRSALGICGGFELCTYVHYRLAWVDFNQRRLKDAVAEMQLALWDAKGNAREEPLRDLIGFMGADGGDARDELALTQALAARAKRPQLPQALADAYLASGNKKAAVYVLESVNRVRPTLSASIRLLEETYGARDWPGLTRQMGDLLSHESAWPGGAAADPESEKILRRLTVQLDGERATRPSATGVFQSATLLYLKLFSDAGSRRVVERRQMIEGWLAAESDPQAKLSRLERWEQEDRAANRPELERAWREARASVAQKIGNFAVVESEMAALAGLASAPEKRFEARYQHAYALYLQKDLARALLEFQALAATLPSGASGPGAGAGAGAGAPDPLSLKSEHLALDILAQGKRFAEVAAQARVWTADPRFASWRRQAAGTGHAAEYADLVSVEAKSDFEAATQLGPTSEALHVFDRNCQAGAFLPQSCENARVLATQLAEQAILVRTLRKLGDEPQLTAELEASGDFAGAARLAEKRLAKNVVQNRDYLKVALLYELAEDDAGRDRLLRAMLKRLQGASSIGPDEELVYVTVRDAGLLNPRTWKLPWSTGVRARALERLAENPASCDFARARLAKSCEDSGPAWESVALSEVSRLDRAQASVHFVGKGGQSKFKRRVAALKEETKAADCYLQGGSARMRAILAAVVARSERAVAEEIQSAPIPEGVDGEARERLTSALAEMGAPFLSKSKEFESLAAEQLRKIDDVSERSRVATAIGMPPDAPAPSAPTPASSPANEAAPSALLAASDAPAASAAPTSSAQPVGDAATATAEPQAAASVPLPAKPPLLAPIDVAQFASPPRAPARLEIEPPAALRTEAIAELGKNANQAEPLRKLKQYYEAKAQPRLASYFQGRLKKFSDVQKTEAVE